MQCPECGSTHIRKNGYRRGKQNHICVACRRQFLENYTPLGYADETKQLCLKMYVNGMGFRGIERVTGVHHTTIITWVKQVGGTLPDAYAPETIPQVGELDELETLALLNSGMNCKSRPHTSPLPTGEGTRILALFSLERRVGDEGKSSLGSATPEY